MREMLESILSTWQLYWGEGGYQYLFFAAFVYLFLFRRKKKCAAYTLVYLAVILVIFWFPPIAYVIRKCIGESVYWRTLWLLPTVPVLALAGAELIKERKSKAVQLFLLLACVGMAVFCGTGMYQAGNYIKVHNYQKVPDEAAAICEMIRSRTPDEEVRLATDDYLASYIRVYDPSIQMPYGRAGRGARGQRSRLLYQEMIAPEPSMKKIAGLSRKKNCDYVAVKLSTEPEKTQKQKTSFQKRGYEEVGTVNAYTLFERKEEK